MKAATKEALLESIEHWRKNESIQKIADAKVGPHHCALCKRFYKIDCSLNEENIIERCPVYESTSHPYCINTPYEKADHAYRDHDLYAFLKAAKQEREFLESLLPADK
jgi:hypothetical protein